MSMPLTLLWEMDMQGYGIVLFRDLDYVDLHKKSGIPEQSGIILNHNFY